ncbi:hypothetical protein TKK_0010650 [Trichogramma kaykai]
MNECSSIFLKFFISQEQIAKLPKINTLFERTVKQDSSSKKTDTAMSVTQEEISNDEEVHNENTLEMSVDDATVQDEDNTVVPIKSTLDVCVVDARAQNEGEVVAKVFPTDVALWSEISNELIDYWIKQNPEMCRNKDADFTTSMRIYKKKIQTRKWKKFDF